MYFLRRSGAYSHSTWVDIRSKGPHFSVFAILEPDGQLLRNSANRGRIGWAAAWAGGGRRSGYNVAMQKAMRRSAC